MKLINIAMTQTNAAAPTGKSRRLPDPDQDDSSAWSYLTPYVDVTDGFDAVNFVVNLPHVKTEDINLAFITGVLTLRAWCSVPALESTERLTGLYFRRFGLAGVADRAGVTAQFANGVLRIKIPYLRSAGERMQVVAVQSAA